jgi:hypothetical protein
MLLGISIISLVFFFFVIIGATQLKYTTIIAILDGIWFGKIFLDLCTDSIHLLNVELVTWTF